MTDSTKKVIKLYAAAVNNDMDKILDFQEVLMAAMRELAMDIQEEFNEMLDEQGECCCCDECEEKNFS